MFVGLLLTRFFAYVRMQGLTVLALRTTDLVKDTDYLPVYLFYTKGSLLKLILLVQVQVLMISMISRVLRLELRYNNKLNININII